MEKKRCFVFGFGCRFPGRRDLLVSMRAMFPVGEPSRSRCNRAGQRRQKASLHRRARACPSPSFALRKNVSCSLQVLKHLKRHRLTMANAGDRPPRYDEKTPSLHVGRGPVPRHRFADRPHHLCRSRSPDPELFVIRRSQTTERGERKKTSLVLFRSVGPKTPLLPMELAGDRPPRYGHIETRRSLLPAEIETRRSLLPRALLGTIACYRCDSGRKK